MSETNNNVPFDTVCIAGMSSKALIALGSLQYLHDTNQLASVQSYLGTSSGTIVAFMLIIGYTPAEMLSYICVSQAFEKLSHFNLVAMMNGAGAASWSKVQEILEKMTIEKIGYLPTMKCLLTKFKKKFTVVTYNLTKSQTEYISADTHPDLPALVAIRMSANLPFVFEKYQYRGSYFIDGGVTDNFPLSKAEEMGKHVIGIQIAKRDKNKIKEKEDNKVINTSFLHYLYKIMMLPVIELGKMQISKARKNTRVVQLKADTGIFAFSFKFTNTQKMDMFSSGYQQIKKILEE
jgi:predicted acylesterase/phospholipase RssA